MLHAGSGIIISNKKVILAKRSSSCKLFPHHWCFPGGRSEANETPEQTAIREVKEEINLDIKNLKLFFNTDYGKRISYYFLARGSGEIKLQETEISDCKEFLYEELEEEKVAFNHRDILKSLREHNLI